MYMYGGDEPVVQGDFTWRAVLVGLAVGCVLCFTNIYFGLQTGKPKLASRRASFV